ncbi:YSC84-related protein [Planktotalea sp.]|uniref:lipid-binding SYLF domain-containing protein n=1 Tax=Planktotalea sp. TaxID=2029877 RepID=UPI0025CECAD1|nr:YSC84-related protein [Planktotalea sp.]
MTNFSRRAFALSGLAGSAVVLSGCDRINGNTAPDRLDARVDATLAEMFGQYGKTRSLAARSAGMLVIPLITEAGLGFGGGFGRGALRVGGVSVEYYNTTKANWGFQIGANQYAHVLFFITEDALALFRASDGWELGAEVEAAIYDDGQTFSTTTTSNSSPVVSIIFGQAGLKLGATIEGTKYSKMRIPDTL